MSKKKIDNIRECREWLKENRVNSESNIQSAEFWGELFDVMETMAAFLDSAVSSLEAEGKLR